MSESGRGNTSQALEFILQKGKWLEYFCAALLRRWGYPDYWAQDVAQNVRFNFSREEDEHWAGIEWKDAYVRRAIWREVKKFCEKRPREEAMDQDVLAYIAGETPGGDPRQLLESKERIQWYRERLTKELRDLFDYYLMNERWGGFKEIAADLGISYGAARKRAERLRERMQSLIEENAASPPTSHDATDNAWGETSLVILADTRD
jgi:DNA-directed RNA polymerase specialized sigma24 family protein